MSERVRWVLITAVVAVIGVLWSGAHLLSAGSIEYVLDHAKDPPSALGYVVILVGPLVMFAAGWFLRKHFVIVTAAFAFGFVGSSTLLLLPHTSNPIAGAVIAGGVMWGTIFSASMLTGGAVGCALAKRDPAH